MEWLNTSNTIQPLDMCQLKICFSKDDTGPCTFDFCIGEKFCFKNS